MWDVIVVGARTAGAPLAMLLARAGLRVLLTDRAAFPSDTLSTHQMQIPAAARLARWGLLDSIAAVTPATTRIRLDASGAVVAGRCPSYGGISAMYSPRRTLLDAMLVDAARAAGAEVWDKFTVKELRWTSGSVTGVRGRERGGQPVTETARLVVGADGKHSFVADAVASSRYRKRPMATFASYSYWADVPMTSGELYQRAERAAAAFPTNEGLTMVYVAAPIREFPSLRRNVEGHFMRTVDTCGDLGERLRAGARVERIRTTPDLPNWLRIPSGPGWALAGDAALVMDPVTAHGMSNAFADADLLAAAITASFSGRVSLTEALAQYRRNRDRRSVAMYDFTVSLAALPRRSSLPLLLQALAGRPDEIDRLLAAFAGVDPVDRYFSVRNLLPLLGPARMLRVTMPGGRRTRPLAGWNGVKAAPTPEIAASSAANQTSAR
jgi:2-polyprenyl-6-methoxyphenol hydroxylase-like FAD-dependent oxidoreductase